MQPAEAAVQPPETSGVEAGAPAASPAAQAVTSAAYTGEIDVGMQILLVDLVDEPYRCNHCYLLQPPCLG